MQVDQAVLDVTEYVANGIADIRETAGENDLVARAIGKFAGYAWGITQTFERDALRWIRVDYRDLASCCLQAHQLLDDVRRDLAFTGDDKPNCGLQTMELQVDWYSEPIFPRNKAWHAFETMAVIFRLICPVVYDSAAHDSDLVSEEVESAVVDRIQIIVPIVAELHRQALSVCKAGDHLLRPQRMETLNILRASFAPSADKLRLRHS